MILSCQHLSIAFTGEEVVRDATFFLEDREKAALVGNNGAGKSTVLKMVAGLLPADSGQAILARGATLGYLAQTHELTGREKLRDYVGEARRAVVEIEERMRSLEHRMKEAEGEELEALMSAYASATHAFEEQNGYALGSEVTGVLKGLGFAEEDFGKPVGNLSGGQMTRAALGRLLLTAPDLLLLDEPTNHLDTRSIAWLEQYLTSYPGAVLVVSHDRYFLNKIAGKVLEIENGVVSSYTGNYDAFAAKKAMLREAQMRAYEKQQAEIRHQEAVIEKLRSFNREKSIKRAESREKALEKIERLEKPQELKTDMNLTLRAGSESGKDVLMLRGLSKAFGSKVLFTDTDLLVRRGERVGIVGENGTGKSTLMRIVSGSEAPTAGTVTLGTGVTVGYYDQEMQVLNDEKTLFEELQDEHPDMNDTRVRSLLAAFLFSGDDVFKRIGDLSGGERGRVSLAKLMLSEANFLLLDEPTNHLDMPSREILEDALSRYEGTVLFVSHDRYFINRTATRILELADGKFTEYLGNYDDYLEKKAQEAERAAAVSADSAAPEKKARADWQEEKNRIARLRKLRSDTEKAEQKIGQIEEELEKIGEEQQRPEVCSDAKRLQELSLRAAELSEALEDAYAAWSALSEELEAAGA
ncbi:MAG: ATP-binding cassette domain-containing protein [Lachnospiraceae bacterium]|nr:ATP-binding cassette domain-containing protein [Lachnospiraceae bacterium]